jgi:hypothetical protein
MNKNKLFWDYFDNFAAPKLSFRADTFRKMFEYLDSIEGPVTIVETGCVRTEGNWGDGQSTVLFDKYISSRDSDSICYSVDINPRSVAECKKLVSNRIQVNQGNSIGYLHQLAKMLSEKKQFISLVYLDSYDIDWANWYPSASHHLKELTAILPCIDKATLVTVDDSPLSGHFILGSKNQIMFTQNPVISGKGRLVAEYAFQTGAKLVFSSYQAGWTGF